MTIIENTSDNTTANTVIDETTIDGLIMTVFKYTDNDNERKTLMLFRTADDRYNCEDVKYSVMHLGVLINIYQIMMNATYGLEFAKSLFKSDNLSVQDHVNLTAAMRKFSPNFEQTGNFISDIDLDSCEDKLNDELKFVELELEYEKIYFE